MPVIRPCQACGARNRIPARHLAETGRCGACKQPLPPLAEPLAADTALFDEVVQTARVPVLVDFWAAWCGPCRMAAPHVARAAAQLSGRALVLKVDTEANPALSARFSIRSIPNFAIFAGGELVRQQAGLLDASQIVRWLEDAAATSRTHI